MAKLEEILEKTAKNKVVRKVAVGTALLATAYFAPELVETITDNVDLLPQFMPTYADHTLAGLTIGLVAGSKGRNSRKEKLSIENILWKTAKFGGLFAIAHHASDLPYLSNLENVANYVPSFLDSDDLLYAGSGLLAGLAGAAWRSPNSETLKKIKDNLLDKWQNVKNETSKNLKKVVGTAAIVLSLGNLCYHLAPIDLRSSLNNYHVKRYMPFSREAKELFREAAKAEGLPESWGDSKGLHYILKKESNGFVGIPNYCIKTSSGRRAKDFPSSWPKIHQELRDNTLPRNRNNCGRGRTSTASGLGQLLIANVDTYYPNGRRGIGDPMSEARGMLRYIKSRYGNPNNAWAQYGKNHEGY